MLPPTVLGFYLLAVFGGQSTLGQWYAALTGRQLVFTFDGLLLASLIANIPFAVQPIQRAFAAIPREACEAAWCSGLSNWQTLWKIELPLAWPGILAALVLTFTHTLGEFGVVLMVGGNIAYETRTVSIAIYDSVQSFNDHAAHVMSAILVLLSVAGIALIHWATQHIGRKRCLRRPARSNSRQPDAADRAAGRTRLRAGRTAGAGRPLGQRQVDAAALHRRIAQPAAGPHPLRRRDLVRRAAAHQPAAAGAPRRLRVPELFAVSAPERARQRALRARPPAGIAARGTGARTARR